MRATFEARGYTAWDPTSFAFIQGRNSLHSHRFFILGGEVLDKITPLLKSMAVLNEQALRILRLFGNKTVRHVHTTVGAEQDISSSTARCTMRVRPRVLGQNAVRRKTPEGAGAGRSLFRPIKLRVSAFMRDLDMELWKLGILAKTKHNEVAPSQHELAPIITVTNVASDQNQLMMETMKKVASRHGLYCLLHEKPFAGVNGSGKHNNWSMSTDTGLNLLDPGSTPAKTGSSCSF